jgi:hypothetical protein
MEAFADAIAVADQIDKQIKDLGLDLGKRDTAPEFAALKVEQQSAKRKSKVTPPRSGPGLRR